MMTARNRKLGFTLIEVMVAMGIFAVGVAMVGTTFPAAILENKESSNEMLGALISRNALTICQNVLRHEDYNGAVGARFAATTDKSTDINQADRIYPTSDSDSRYGWIVAIRQMTSGANDYQLAIVVFRKFASGDTPRFYDASVTGGKLDNDSDALGSPVIMANTGEFARILSTGDLDANLDDGAVIVVRNPNGAKSPAFFCLVVRTSLAHRS